MDADGTNLVQLTTGTINEGKPHWSPNGSKIVYKSALNGHHNVWTMNSDGTGQTQLTFDTDGLDYINNGPDWSPDGSKIVFARRTGGIYNIWLMNTDGSSQIQLTNNPSNEGHPCFSPDGNSIVYTGDQEIGIMDVDGSNQKRSWGYHYSK